MVMVVTPNAGRVPGAEQEVLGAAPVCARIFLRDGAVDGATIKAYMENQKWDYRSSRPEAWGQAKPD